MHEGRVAWYGPHHRERLLHIRHLKERGYSLRMIPSMLRMCTNSVMKLP